jgi:parallel beta-helix repeat protein
MSHLAQAPLVRRSAVHCGIALLLLAAASPALAEYNCFGGVPIPGGTTGVTYNITAPGCYWLAGNRNMTGAGPAIAISASHVFLDLRGRTLRHAVVGAVIVQSTAPITDLHLVNGKLTGAQGGIGVQLVGNPNGDFNISDLVISDLGGAGLPGLGIFIGGGGAASPAHAVIARNVIDVYRDGIVLDLVDGGRIENNVLVGRPNPGTPSNGIRLGDCDGNDIRGNTISAIQIPGAPIGTGIAILGNSNYNNIQHNTISKCWDGILVDNSTCNVIDWNVSQGNLSSAIQLTATTTGTIYSFNRGSGFCTASGSGLLDLGANVNAGNNF